MAFDLCTVENGCQVGRDDEADEALIHLIL
jgi:hypothetical protein